MLSAGAGVIVANLNPLGGIIEAGFNIRGVIPNNEAIVSVAQKVLGVETMSILLLGLFFNLLIARRTKYKYIFLTGHHFLPRLSVLGGTAGGRIRAAGCWIDSGFGDPPIGQRYTKQVTEDGGIAMGHFGSLGITSPHGSPAKPATRRTLSPIPKSLRNGAFCAIPRSLPGS